MLANKRASLGEQSLAIDQSQATVDAPIRNPTFGKQRPSEPIGYENQSVNFEGSQEVRASPNIQQRESPIDVYATEQQQ